MFRTIAQARASGAAVAAAMVERKRLILGVIVGIEPTRVGSLTIGAEAAEPSAR
jgi:hypothetical protein